MSEDQRHRAAQVAIARAPVLTDGPDRPRLPADLTDPAAVRAFLLAVLSDPVVAEAITVSSSSLATILDRVAAGAEVEPKRLRGAALSAARYLSRMTHRGTPFGLLAGVSAVQFQDCPKVRVGTRHRRGVRVDMGWLSAVVQPWETDPDVLPHLTLVANDLGFVRGDRLVLPYVHEDRTDWAPDDREHSVRHTGAVAATMTAARTPIRYPDLLAGVSAAFPDAEQGVVAGMLAGLVEHEFLLTDLRPPSGADDPLDHVLTVLAPLHRHAGRDALLRVREQLRDYAETPLGAGRDAWRRATATMRELHDTGDRLIQVDLRWDADLLLPHEVADEVRRAATLAWRVAPASATPGHRLAAYRARFLERYGPGVVVPVRELLDPHTGLGPPDGYLLPPARHLSAEQNPMTERDRALIALAQRATRTGAPEIVLDEDLAARLARPGDTQPTYAEAAFQLVADSEEALAAGDFLVELSQTFPRPGELFGRFLHLLPELGDAVTELARDTVGDGAAQLEHLHLYPRNANVTQVPTLLAESVRVGVFADRARPDVHGLPELGIGADHEALFLVSLRTGQRVVPLPLHALNPRLTVPNPVRFLYEIGEQHTPSWPAWDWGHAAQLPYLPRVRSGRTVLAPARWLVDPALRDGSLDVAGWSRLFERWRADWAPPDVVDVVSGDQRVRVDLTGSGRTVAAARRTRQAARGCPPGSAWTGRRGLGARARGRDRATAPPTRDRPLRTAGYALSLRASTAYPPGGEWLYVKVYADEPQHGELLGRALGALVDHALPVTDRWFFLRYRDERPAPAAALPRRPGRAEHAPAARSARLGGGSGVPQADPRDRAGHLPARDPALRRTRADRPRRTRLPRRFPLRARPARLLERGRIGLPIEWLLAANTLDLAARLHGEGWQDWLLAAIPRNTAHAAFQRHRDAIMNLGPDRPVARPGPLSRR